MSEYIEVGQPLQFTDPNTPTRVGEIVENVSDIYNIPSPRLGMQVFVKSEKKNFVITALKSKNVNGVDVPEAAVEAFEPVGAKAITWVNEGNPSDMNDFVVAGVYDIKGERKRENDNLPILNTGGGHTFNARLTVLDSSISDTTNSDDKCITQKLTLSNRVGGDGNVYIRTGRGRTYDSITWEKWGTLQTNINVGQVRSLDEFVDNGIYSGVWTDGSSFAQTFVMVVINDYAVAGGNKTIVQYKYAYDTLKGNGEPTYNTRSLHNGVWSDWEDTHDDDLESLREMLSSDIVGETLRAEEAEETLRKNIDNTNNVVGIEEKGKLTVYIGAVMKDGSTYSTNNSAYTNAFEGGDIAVTNEGYFIYDVRKVSADGVAEMVIVKSRRLRTEKGYTYQLNITKDSNGAFSNDELDGIVGLYNYDSSEIEKNKTDIQYLFEEAVKFDSFEVEELGDGIGINYDSFDGNNGGSIEIPFATTEKAGVMSAEDRKVSVKSRIKVTDGKFTQFDYIGIYCTNVNTGNVSTANSTSNGILVSVNAGDKFEITGDNLKYGTQSVQLYSGYPSLDTNVTTVIIYKNKVTIPQGVTHMLVSVNPSLGSETFIKQLNWATIEDLPQSYEEVLENIGSEYKTQVINVTQGVSAGNNKIFPISLLSAGDTIQIYVKSDIAVKMSLVTANGRVIQSIITNQIIAKQITSDDITGNSFGFYINQTQATQSGTLNCSLRIVKKESSPITLSKALVDVVNAPKSISDINKNLGSYYQELMANVEVGELLNARDFIFTDIEANCVIEFIAECDEDITYGVLTTNGIFPFGNGYFSTNVLYKGVCKSNFITSLQASKRWGVYIPADKATVSTTIHFKVRLISNDTFSLQHTIDNTKEQVISLEEVVGSVVEIPVNNKNIKNWNMANKLVTRLYVENKELALADGLYVRQFFRALNDPKNNGFNFGTRTTDLAITIAPRIGDFDYYETISATYGKIAIKIADWDAIEWPSSGVISIGVLSESNLEDIVFDWDEFIKPLDPTTTIADGSITENKLSEDVKTKLNSSAPPLSGYELFSLGDSLSAGGVWQTKVAELTGCIFDQKKNNKGGAMLSVGGISSFGDTFDNVLWRTKNLIDQNYIAGQGENAIVILENVNDGYQVFDGDDKSIIPTNPIEGYNDADFGVELLESISDKAALNAVLRLNKVVAGKNLKIDTLPTKAGTVTLRVGWAGPGYSNYNIYVEPQATQEETLNYVLDKILEYAYTGITDVLGEDGRSVDFSSGNSNYLPTVQFTDTDNTGMTCTVTDNPNAKGSIARYFIGDTIEEWTDTSKWQKGITYSQGWKSSIEMLQRAYPKLHIFVSMFPLHSVTASEYLLPNGSYDTTSYNKVSRMETMRKMQVELGNIAKFYSIPLLDVFAECGIGINNMLTYYNASANVHPKNEGYYRFGETVATQLKRYLL